MNWYTNVLNYTVIKLLAQYFWRNVIINVDIMILMTIIAFIAQRGCKKNIVCI